MLLGIGSSGFMRLKLFINYLFLTIYLIILLKKKRKMNLFHLSRIFLLFGAVAGIQGSVIPEESGAPSSKLYPGIGMNDLIHCGSGDLYCKPEEMCEYLPPSNCPEYPQSSHPPRGNATTWEGKGACPPVHVCNKCCPETCATMECCGDAYCVYQETECFQAPCCPVAVCVMFEDAPFTTCANVKCPINSRCRLMQKKNCNDPKTCIYATCSVYACAGAKFCMY